ncbi:MAG: cyclic 2,3-diphosphoglycerate synthase [Gemmatimonadota bacterium]
MARRALILGAAGRDFHNFNVCYREDPDTEVVAFTATQIPNIDGRRYPPSLAGDRYPDGIPIEAEADLEDLIARLRVDAAVFSYSDVSHERVMHVASRCLAAGADFELLSARRTMLAARRPVVAVCAARTGCGKSQTSRRVAAILEEAGRPIAVVRHPMPYGDLERQAVQRFADFADLDAHEVTIEEREEYEPHLRAGRVVYAGVDYEAILRRAEEEAEIIVWDGGNNDLPFYAPDLHIVVVDPHRPDHALRYHPGEANVRMADVIVVNKVDTAAPEDLKTCRRVARELSPTATLVEAESPISVEEPERVTGARVLVIEDGPTLTHGEMAFGAGWVAARRHGAAEIVDPRPYAVGSIEKTYERYPTTGAVLPAMGYGDDQLRELEETIRATPADVVLVATPIDLRHLVAFDKPALHVRYELRETGSPTLEDALAGMTAAE